MSAVSVKGLRKNYGSHEAVRGIDFEIAPGGHSTLERHDHAHSVIILRGRGQALVGERMVAAGSGSIINVSSAGSLRPDAGMIPYAAAKAGLNAMTEGLARAFGPTVRVNTLMADGSVKFTKDTINVLTWQALGSRNGGEVISADAY